jgi:hypothetical protein
VRSIVFACFFAVVGCGSDDGAAPSAEASSDSSSDSAASDAQSPDTREETPPDAPAVACGDPMSAPVVGTWRGLSTSGLPSIPGIAVWTGSETILVHWSSTTRTLAAYDPAKDTWRSIAIDASAPSARDYPYVGFAAGRVWLWGGKTSSGTVASGGSLDPATGTWTAMATSGAPDLPYLVTNSPRAFELGGKVVFAPSAADKGKPAYGLYDPATSTWSSVTSTNSLYGCDTLTWSATRAVCDHLAEIYELGPTTTSYLLPRGSSLFARWNPTFVGETLYSWGGDNDISANPTYEAAVYDFGARKWTTLSHGPVARGGALLGALGDKLVIWGGVAHDPASKTAVRRDGAVYDPTAKSWSAMPCAGAPTDSSAFSAYVFTGTELLVFGSKASAYSL